MYSLIIKITHSTRAKDTIAIVRGIYRVAAGGMQTNSQPKQKSWLNEVQSSQELKQEPPPEYNKKTYLQNISVSNPQPYQPMESHIPASRIGRFFEFGKLGLNLVSASWFAGKDKDQKYYESIGNNISDQLCKMRGAPLKLAQMLSIQEDNLIPEPIRKAFEKARQSAHIIPMEEVEFMLVKSLGENWRERFQSFNEKPFAAASIGQVHRGTLLSGEQVAVKVQYKAVKKSIESDIDNLSILMKIPNLFPKTMYIERILKKTKEQLMSECDYLREKRCQQLYSKCLEKCLGSESNLYRVPKVFEELTSEQIFTSEYLWGLKMKDIETSESSQELKDEIGRRIMLLTFKEMFEMGIMQSDPNPSNFTFNPEKDQLNLFDFGATHIYSPQFLSSYHQIIKSSVEENHEQIWQASIKTGFVTGQENKLMRDNHIESIIILGEPLRHEGEYDFGSQKITQKIYKTIPLMLKNRIKPPPQEIYSLHRKFSGSYLACIRLGARVDCNKLWKEIRFGNAAQQLI